MGCAGATGDDLGRPVSEELIGRLFLLFSVPPETPDVTLVGNCSGF